MIVGYAIVAFGACATVFGGYLAKLGHDRSAAMPRLNAPGTDTQRDAPSPPHSAAPVNSTELVWDDHLGHSYSTEGTTIITQAVQIGAKNGSDREIRLEEAYIVSGQGSGEIHLKVGTDRGWITPRETNPIPPNGPIVFRAEFNPMPAREFFEKWKTFQITVRHDGGAIINRTIDEKMVAAIYSSFQPNPIGPQVTRRDAPTSEPVSQNVAGNLLLAGTASILFNSEDNSFYVLKYSGSIRSVAVEREAPSIYAPIAQSSSIIFVFPPQSGPFDVRITNNDSPFGLPLQVTDNNDRSVSVSFNPVRALVAPQTRTLQFSFYRKQ